MSSKWNKNETDATKRVAYLDIYKLDGVTSLERGTDLTGKIFLGKSSTLLVQAAGTIVNVRKPITDVDTIEATDTVADTVQVTAHPFETGDGPYRPDATGGGLDTTVDIYIISVDANHIAFADSLAHAYAGTKLDLTADVTGVGLSAQATCGRGLDGQFMYTGTQAETNFSGSELMIYAIDPANITMAKTSVMIDEGATVWDVISENGLSYGDYERLKARTHGAKYSVVGNVITFRDFADTKDSHQGTITEDGRIAITIIDLSP